MSASSSHVVSSLVKSKLLMSVAAALLLAGCSDAMDRFASNPSDADPVYTASVPKQKKLAQSSDDGAEDSIASRPLANASVQQPAYDYSKSCSYCGAGRQQVGDLVLDLRRVPVSLDIAVSITGEWTVSRRLAELLASDYPSVQLAPIRHRAQFDQDAIQLDEVPAGRELLAAAAEEGLDASSWEFIVWLNADRQNALYGRAVREHVTAASRDGHSTEDQTAQPGHRYQLRLEKATVRVDARTEFGSTPTDRLSGRREGATSIGSHRCPLGHTLGLNALSPLYVDRSSWDGSEIVRTEQLVGERVGVFVPRPFVLISSGVYRALVANAIKGFRVEVAHLV